MSAEGIELRLRIAHEDFSLDARLDLPGSGVSALVGPSGSGKTSLLRAIAGLEHHRGSLKVKGEVWQDDDAKTFLPTHRRALGYVFQEASLLPHLSVAGNLDFGWKRVPPELRRADREKTLALLGIAHLLERVPASLSGGERQRVAMARALFASPSLILMDEPLASLDLSRKQEVLPYLERIHHELAIPMLYVSHSPEEVARLADFVVLLGEGAVRASGPVTEITSRLDLPGAREDDAGVVLTGTVEHYDPNYHLATLAVEGGLVSVVHGELAAGARLRLRILARDVSLSLAPHRDSSVLNQLRAKVLAETPGKTPELVTLRLDSGGMPLLARITRQSRDRLALAPGSEVWAQFKAAAVMSEG